MSESSGGGPVLHRAVSEQAAARPEATAIFHRGTRISYRTLNAAADSVAADLAAHGVGTGAVVPVVMPRSPALITADLAILKCGAAYTNVDPGWPAERVASLIGKLDATVVVTGTADDHRDLLAAGATVLECPADLNQLVGKSAPFKAADVGNEAPAMVFFTSGTTGDPKGVIVSHGAVSRMFSDDGLTGFGPGHAMVQAAAIAWDAHALEVWGQLTTGGCCALLPGSYLMPAVLRDLVLAAGVDTIFLTTALFNVLVDEDIDSFCGLSTVMVGGEKLSVAHISAFLQRHPEIALSNVYGPVENCIFSTIHRIQPSDCDLPGGIPLGQAVSGTTIDVLAENGRPCAPGEIGEITTAGSGLAIGYIGEPELTATKFPSTGGVRRYLTGDLGSLDDGGRLHFHGRRDRQVKINGHRVELAEIEKAAGAIAGVRECMVVPIHAPGGEIAKLALCYVTEQDLTASEGTVRDTLRRTMPAYLVPSVIRIFERFPMTANGKVDQRELQRRARPRSNHL